MIITLKRDTPKAEVEKLIYTSGNKGLSVTMIQRDNYNVFGLVSDTSKIDGKLVKTHLFAENIIRIATSYERANRLLHPADTIVDIAGVKVGGNGKIVVIGGPCSVEGDTQIMDIIKEVKNAGGDMLRSDAYKPRTSPCAFQGMGTEGVRCMVHARETYGLLIVNELISADKIGELVGHVGLIQIGARSIQNFGLLEAVGRINKPVLLKRGPANTIEEWIMTVEYVMSGGSEDVIFCEHGIRTFETCTRNTLDLSVVPIIKEKTHLPIIIDPSHTTGSWKLVESASLAAIAASADGLIIEMHNDPKNTWSDGTQSLKPERFDEMIRRGRRVTEVIGRSVQALLPLHT